MPLSKNARLSSSTSRRSSRISKPAPANARAYSLALRRLQYEKGLPASFFQVAPSNWRKLILVIEESMWAK
jgi:hypothetical protein